MKTSFALTAAIILALSHSPESFAQQSEKQTEPRSTVLVVIGADGESQYGRLFAAQAKRWEAAALAGRADCRVIGGKATRDDKPPRDELADAIQTAKSETAAPLWIVMLGHGTFDRREARFNLAGPDVSAEELSSWLAPVVRPTAIIVCASSSGPFVNVLSGKNRVVVAATKNGQEQNFSRFGEFLSLAVTDLSADLDKDNQVSLFEAFLKGARDTEAYYRNDGRIATEHPLIDDDGDRAGTRASAYRGLQAISIGADGKPLDGVFSSQWHLVPNSAEASIPFSVRAERDRLERAIIDLRSKKDQQQAEVYEAGLEKLLIELAELMERYEASPTR